MKETLDKTIAYEHLVWDNTLTDKKQQFVVELGSEIIAELIKRRNELDKLTQNDLPLLKNTILVFRKKMLLDGFGLFCNKWHLFAKFFIGRKNCNLYTNSKNFRRINCSKYTARKNCKDKGRG